MNLAEHPALLHLEDIMEEIIGDIKDEFDDEESTNKKIDEYNYIFEGKTMINDVCKAMNLPMILLIKLVATVILLAGLGIGDCRRISCR